MPGIVIANTTPAYLAREPRALRWLENAEHMAQDAKSAGFDSVSWFASLQVDGRGKEWFSPILERLAGIESATGAATHHWWFSLDDGATEVTGGSRLWQICTGRNLVHEFILRYPDVSHVLFLDSDLVPPANSISELLALNHPVVGGDVPAYCMSGPRVEEALPARVEARWNTAGFLLVQRDVLRKVRWRHDPQAGMTDDPCFALDAQEAGFGPTWVHKDVVGLHPPLVPLHKRKHDLVVYR